MTRAGASCHRVGFNLGDWVFWRDRASFTRFDGTLAEWPAKISELIEAHKVTDLVIYGDMKTVHAEAIRQAALSGLRVHVFEEGYLRPWWITYERGGSNGHSPLMEMSVDQMHAFLEAPAPEPVEAPGTWGALRRHMFYGAVYHFAVMVGRKTISPDRGIPVSQELRLHLRRLFLLPLTTIDRIRETARIRAKQAPYHLLLLQLDHDASLRAHGAFASTEEFLTRVIFSFAAHAPAHHQLVIKTHPLEDGRVPIRKIVRHLTREAKVTDRVYLLGGGKLAGILNGAKSAITVTSTAAQQALMRGIPVKAFGRAVYTKPEFVSDQAFETFFTNPKGPDSEAYSVFRQFLLETSQIPGSYYARSGRAQAIRRLPDMMLAMKDRYERPRPEIEAQKQHLGEVPR
jgi:capsular polysaccharide export protein